MTQKAHLIEPQALDLGVPRKGSEELVQVFGGIAKAREIFAQHNNHIWAYLLCFFDKLELVETLMHVSGGDLASYDASKQYVYLLYDELRSCRWPA